MIESTMLIERNPFMKTIVVQDDVVVANLALCKCFALNGTASAVWNALETPRTVEQIRSVLLEHFDVDAERCQSELTALIAKWTKLGLVQPIV